MRPLQIAEAATFVLGLQDEIGRSEEFRYDQRLHGALLVAQGMTCPEAGLILVRELDERLGLAELIEVHLVDSRTGCNRQFPLGDLLRQSVYSRLAGYEDLNDAARVSADPGFAAVARLQRK